MNQSVIYYRQQWAQRSEIHCPRSHSYLWEELGSQLVSVSKFYVFTLPPAAFLMNHNAQCCALRVTAPRAELGKAWSLTLREDQRLHCVSRVKRMFLIEAASFTVFQPHCSPFGSLSLPQGLDELD